MGFELRTYDMRGEGVTTTPATHVGRILISTSEWMNVFTLGRCDWTITPKQDDDRSNEGGVNMNKIIVIFICNVSGDRMDFAICPTFSVPVVYAVPFDTIHIASADSQTQDKSNLCVGGNDRLQALVSYVRLLYSTPTFDRKVTSNNRLSTVQLNRTEFKTNAGEHKKKAKGNASIDSGVNGPIYQPPAFNAQLPTSPPQIIGERNCGSYNHCTANELLLLTPYSSADPEAASRGVDACGIVQNFQAEMPFRLDSCEPQIARHVTSRHHQITSKVSIEAPMRTDHKIINNVINVSELHVPLWVPNELYCQPLSDRIVRKVVRIKAHVNEQGIFHKTGRLTKAVQRECWTTEG
ncbi:hypothetical protein CLF_100533 [Clonorchis sinensis]|uniref:Uncharacterized protein n=1 Tax=Clonorchis sinensis TaxID=79923 RepID=G7Y3N8_CLOSI|nr:hypothetical protein CLF_100533 [Clonorchis sinensis]